MNDPKKSDTGIVARKPANKAARAAAELVERRPRDQRESAKPKHGTDTDLCGGRRATGVPTEQAPCARRSSGYGNSRRPPHGRTGAGTRFAVPQSPEGRDGPPYALARAYGSVRGAPTGSRHRASHTAKLIRFGPRDFGGLSDDTCGNATAGGCSYVDPQTGRRCNSTHLIEIDHIVPHALEGRRRSSEPQTSVWRATDA